MREQDEDGRLEAFGRLALEQNAALLMLVEHVRALVAINRALLVHLTGEADQAAIRETAEEALGPAGLVPGGLAAQLVEALTGGPDERQAVAGVALADSLWRLQ